MPECAGLLDFKFCRDFAEVAHMIYNGPEGHEWVSLEPFPVRLNCMTCAWAAETVGRNFTISIPAGKVLLAYIDRPT